MEFSQLLQQTKTNMTNAIEHLKTDYSNVRTGRASSALIENMLIDSYGTKSPLKAVASISTPDATTLIIQPWDKNIIPNIEKSFLNSNLGLSPVSEGHLLRLNIPKPTEEKRKELVKVIHDKAEQCRVSLRNERQSVHQEIKNMKQDSKITEDDFYQYDKQLQDVLSEFTEESNKLAAQKEEELMTV